MRLRHHKTLITGEPGVGKTTLVQRVVERIPTAKMAGFHTAEIRAGGRRLGFELRGLNGERRTLAHMNIHSPHRVSKYGVDTAGFEAFLENLDLLDPEVELVVIDEIGKMELFSSRFQALLREVLGSRKELLATIAMKGGGLIREIKQRPDVYLLEVTRTNRDRLPGEIPA
jgi:nucleoside-triphosphatase